ncbi:hypothetical protein AVEN_243012-1 [Araneus ventricosus]|uniref:Uncharacterized protein n=1 Tax=Araneus ventricosus TaxID=182803 RepID=A0A4Y2D4A9_ARAVE|nr:hypothetical protein AVEN_243012-1 [Araneus ventricosus]
MEYAKKMVLIPEDRAEFVDHLSELDAKMQDILQRKDLLENEKANRYLQIVQKFVKIQHPQQEKAETETDQNQEPESALKENTITAKILKAAPVRYINTAKNILDFLKVNSPLLSWTSEGEIT